MAPNVRLIRKQIYEYSKAKTLREKGMKEKMFGRIKHMFTLN